MDNIEAPATGIAKIKDSAKYKSYVVHCACSDSSHQHHVFVENIGDDQLEVSTYVELHTAFWSKSRWYYIWRLLTKGFIKVESDIIMDKQTALNYAYVLTKAANESD